MPFATLTTGIGGNPYDRCAPDEVWAWQMDYRPDAENREWECVAVSDLKEVGK